jgi:hypothetical protein
MAGSRKSDTLSAPDPQTPQGKISSHRSKSPSPSPGQTTPGSGKKLVQGHLHERWTFTKGNLSVQSEQYLEQIKSTTHKYPRDRDFNKGWESLAAKLEHSSEAKVIQDIGEYVVPSAEKFARATTSKNRRQLEYLIETVNQSWSKAMSLSTTRPKPDKCVGFRSDAFTKEQLDFINQQSLDKTNPFMGDDKTFFPCFASEAKSSAKQTLDNADHQNYNTMRYTLHGMVELFKILGKVKELHGRILGFAISWQQSDIRTYAYYVVVKGSEIQPARVVVKHANLITDDGKFRWTGYQISKNIYELWMPKHLEFIRGALDEALKLRLVSDSNGPDIANTTGALKALQLGVDDEAKRRRRSSPRLAKIAATIDERPVEDEVAA